MTSDERDLRIGLAMLPADKVEAFKDIARHIPSWRTDVLVAVVWELYGECIVPETELDPLPADHERLDTAGRAYELTLNLDPTSLEEMQEARRTYLNELRLVRQMVADGVARDMAWRRAIRRTATAGRKPKIKRLRKGRTRS